MSRLDPFRRAPEPLQAVRELLVGSARLAAEPATIRVLKAREGCGRWLFAVSFRNGRRRRMFGLLSAERTEQGGWIARNFSGGPITPPHRPGRWVNVEGWISDGRFNAGGQVLRQCADVAEVRLCGADGIELAADASAGIVLFLADGLAAPPPTAVVLDGEGRVLASHPAF